MNDVRQLHEPIGRLVVTFGQLEFYLGLLVVALLDKDPNVGMALVSEMSFSRRIDALQSIASLVISDSILQHELRSLIATLGQAEQNRNTIVHTVWMASPDKLFRMKPSAKRKKGVQTNLRGTSPQDVEKATQSVQSSFSQLLRFVKKLQDGKIISIWLVGEIAESG